ncbi:DDE-type integrase/transposase/recombinase, partial [Pseudovibrio sp. POLY-S9]|uniref:DDE-type integrase/transposase/recombinase n=1 Tax=Pseudovibrio sp. POLY-S9 TaxID=1576596 RepID=UPI000A82120B
ASRGCYGSKRIHAELVTAGEVVSQRRVTKLMKENGISPSKRGPVAPVTTLSNHKKSPSPNLLQQEFDCYTPNTVWLADITYCATDEGWLYVAAIKDMATREIVGWAMDKHMKADLCCAALKMALGRRGPVVGLIHHSDRGSQ